MVAGPVNMEASRSLMGTFVAAPRVVLPGSNVVADGDTLNRSFLAHPSSNFLSSATSMATSSHTAPAGYRVSSVSAPTHRTTIVGRQPAPAMKSYTPPSVVSSSSLPVYSPPMVQPVDQVPSYTPAPQYARLPSSTSAPRTSPAMRSITMSLRPTSGTMPRPSLVSASVAGIGSDSMPGLTRKLAPSQCSFVPAGQSSYVPPGAMDEGVYVRSYVPPAAEDPICSRTPLAACRIMQDRPDDSWQSLIVPPYTNVQMQSAQQQQPSPEGGRKETERALLERDEAMRDANRALSDLVAELKQQRDAAARERDEALKLRDAAVAVADDVGRQKDAAEHLYQQLQQEVNELQESKKHADQQAAAASTQSVEKQPAAAPAFAMAVAVPTTQMAVAVPCKWPHEVSQFLQWVRGSGTVVHQASSNGKLMLQPSVCQIPHPSKAKSGGEDAFFLSDHSLGVADGVGEWAAMGVNPRDFADELMNGSSAHLTHLATNPQDAATGADLAQDRAHDSLREAFKAAKSYGSATAILVTLDAAAANIGIANVGDSSFRLLRRNGRVELVARTKEQQHSYNCPFQLVRKPAPEDFQALIDEGKEEFVKRCSDGSLPLDDDPECAQLYNFKVQEGDLLLLGSDGVFDNLYDDELCELAENFAWPVQVQEAQYQLTHPEYVAKAISYAAYYKAADQGAQTPFADTARKNNVQFSGGKMDDITTVCAWVTKGAQ